MNKIVTVFVLLLIMPYSIQAKSGYTGYVDFIDIPERFYIIPYDEYTTIDFNYTFEYGGVYDPDMFDQRTPKMEIYKKSAINECPNKNKKYDDGTPLIQDVGSYWSGSALSKVGYNNIPEWKRSNNDDHTIESTYDIGKSAFVVTYMSFHISRTIGLKLINETSTNYICTTFVWKVTLSDYYTDSDNVNYFRTLYEWGIFSVIAYPSGSIREAIYQNIDGKNNIISTNIDFTFFETLGLLVFGVFIAIVVFYGIKLWRYINKKAYK